MFKKLLGFAVIGIVQEILWMGLCSLGPLRERTGSFLALIIPIFALCLWAYYRYPLQSKHSLKLLIGFALLFRLTVLIAPPHQSEDVYRYIWDAQMAATIGSPYTAAPNAPELEKYRDTHLYPLINSKPYITAYPPVTQILFRMCYGIFGPNVTAMKAVFSILEFLSLLLAWKLLTLWGRSPQTLVLMAWNPFFIFEFSHSGHSDSASMFLILLAVYLLSKNRKSWAMASYAGAVLAKLHPALWFPLFVRRTGWKPVIAGAVTGITVILLYFNFDSWMHYLASLSLYFKLFEFNASIHYLIRFLGKIFYQESWDKLIGPYLGSALFIITVLISWKFPLRDARDLLHAGFWIMVADLCLATTVHPWYLSWAALAIPFFPYAFMVYWTGACFLSYLAYSYHPVFEPSWVLLVEYIPVYTLMAWEIWRKRPLLVRAPETL
jgi:alpha-1,6-mannosyltransferase